MIIENSKNVYESKDEIDLVAIFLKIWREKLLIFVIVCAGSVVAFIVLSILPVQYRIDATIDMARSEELRPIWPSILESKAYQTVGSAVAAPVTFEGKEYQAAQPDEKKIYNNILLQVGSFNMFKSFWEVKTGKQLNFVNNGSPTGNEQNFKALLDSFVLEPSNPKTPDVTARKISIEHHDPVEGVAVLTEYLKYVNRKTWIDQLASIKNTYIANLAALESSYNSRNEIEQNKLNDEILRLRENLKIAESLNIKETPFKELENIQLKILDSRDYLLGAKTLSQQLDILIARQGKSLSPFVSDLRSMEVWRGQMMADLARFEAFGKNVDLFKVVNTPESTLDPVRPKKLLIVAICSILSALLAIVIVLIKSEVRARRDSNTRES